MMRSSTVLATWTLVAALLVPGVCLGDWIQLDSGVQVHGKILRQSRKEITLELDRGGVSSFDMRLVVKVHRTSSDARKKLDLDDEAKKKADRERPRVRTEADRSARRPVPGGTLLLPESAIRDSTPDPDPRAPKTKPRWEAAYRLDAKGTRILVGRAAIDADDTLQTEAIRRLHGGERGFTLVSLEKIQVAGLPIWIAEWTIDGPEGRSRRITSWVRLGSEEAQVIRVDIGDDVFLLDPYRFRVIPRTFRKSKDSPDGAATPASAPGRGR